MIIKLRWRGIIVTQSFSLATEFLPDVPYECSPTFPFGPLFEPLVSEPVALDPDLTDTVLETESEIETVPAEPHSFNAAAFYLEYERTCMQGIEVVDFLINRSREDMAGASEAKASFMAAPGFVHTGLGQGVVASNSDNRKDLRMALDSAARCISGKRTDPIEPTSPPRQGSGAACSVAEGSPKRTRLAAAEVPAPVDDFDFRSFAKQMELTQNNMMAKFVEQMRAQHIEKEETLTSLESTARATLAAIDGLTTKFSGLETRLQILESREPEPASLVQNERIEALESSLAELKQLILDGNKQSAPVSGARGGGAPAWGAPSWSPLQSPRGMAVAGPGVTDFRNQMHGGGGGGGGPGGGFGNVSWDRPERFIPNRAFIRGWSDFETKATTMLPGENVVAVMNAVRDHMPHAATRCISNMSAPYFRNWQGTFSFADNTNPDDIFAFAKLANEVLKQDDMKLNNKQLYITVDKPPWKKEQNSMVARADRTFRAMQNANVLTCRIDWSSGQLWCTAPREALLGGISRTRSGPVWKWEEDAISRLGVSMVDLSHAFSDLS